MLRSLILLTFFALPAFAEEALTREELSREPAPGSTTHEVIVSKLTIPPGVTVPRNVHAGDEYLVVVVGGTMQAPNGKEIPFPPGATARFPAGVVHGGLTNVGEADLVAITTHIVEIGKPLNLPLE